MLNWESEESHLFFNSRFPEEMKAQFMERFVSFPELKGHLFIATSGTTSTSLKWAALSKKAFLTSAAAVNRFLDATQNDVWINPLPDHHVGGLSIYARAHLANVAVYNYTCKWEPSAFGAYIQQYSGTLTSLVPTKSMTWYKRSCTLRTHCGRL